MMLALVLAAMSAVLFVFAVLSYRNDRRSRDF